MRCASAFYGLSEDMPRSRSKIYEKRPGATHRWDVRYGAHVSWVTTHVAQTCITNSTDGIGTHIVVRERDSVQQMEFDAMCRSPEHSAMTEPVIAEKGMVPGAASPHALGAKAVHVYA